MDLPFDDLYPIDFLSKISPHQYWQTASHLWKNRPMDAIEFLARECGLPLWDAFQTHRAVSVDLDCTFPPPCLVMAGALNAIGQPEKAVEWVAAYTGQDTAYIHQFVQAVAEYLPGQISTTGLEDIIKLVAVREFMPAAAGLRKIMDGIDLTIAIGGIHDLQKMYPPFMAGQLPQKYHYKIQHPGERYSRSFRKLELDATIEQMVIEQYPPADREVVRQLLGMYGRDAWEPEDVRVQRVVLQRAKGDPYSVLRLVKYGKIDYRDVLIGEE